MTNPIEELETLYAETTQGEWEADKHNISVPARERWSNEIGMFLDDTEETCLSDFANARHAAVMHNVTPELFQLMRDLEMWSDCMYDDPDKMQDALIWIHDAKEQFEKALRKELEK
jgi:hypothetical protein